MEDRSVLRGAVAPENAVWLDSLNLKGVIQQWGDPQAGKTIDNQPIQLDGRIYEHGLGTHAYSEMLINLKGVATRFVCEAGISECHSGHGSVTFEVWVDGKKAVETGVLRGGDKPEFISVDLAGANELFLVVTDAADGIHMDMANWVGALIYLEPGAKDLPETVLLEDEPPIPIASGDAPEPAIHGPRVVGTTPGMPFLFLIPATGEGPLSFSAMNLPDELILDSMTGIITGSVADAGEWIVELSVEGPRGSASRELKIVAGDHKLALTPPLGWNSWNVWATAVDDDKIRAAADWMVKSGLAAHGFQYVNIDDCWEGERDANGEIVPNEKFPDMKALSDYVHSKGLKLGIYSSPGPKTCGGYEGSYLHEEQDALTWAKWGFDYIKHDWCSYWSIALDRSRGEFEKPYQIMCEALGKCDRDIVYSLCNGGEGDVWEWGGKVGGNCWRTTPDITDSWSSIASIAFTQDGREKYAGPGRWNDVDMLVLGDVGWGPNLHPTRLTPNEQILHITAWCMLASPMLIGCDLSQLDKFTIDLLTNDDVLDVNQDPLGVQSTRKSINNKLEVWSRPLWDGTLAVALFNRGLRRADVTANWSDLGITGDQPVRDLWQKKNLGEFDGSFTASVPGHGAMLLKIGKPDRQL